MIPWNVCQRSGSLRQGILASSVACRWRIASIGRINPILRIICDGEGIPLLALSEGLVLSLALSQVEGTIEGHHEGGSRVVNGFPAHAGIGDRY